MSQENPLASSSKPVHQSRSQDSLNLQDRGLPPTGQEVKIRAHRNLSSHNLRHQNTRVGSAPQPQFAYNRYRSPQPLVLQLPPARIQRPHHNFGQYAFNYPHGVYNPALVPAFNGHPNNMGLMSALYTNRVTQELEIAPTQSPTPYTQVNTVGTVRNRKSEIAAVSYQSVQSVYTSSYNQVNVSISSTTYYNKNQGMAPPPAYYYRPQIVNSPQTFPQSPYTLNTLSGSEASSPQFYQNAMQHPLLTRNVTLDEQMKSLNQPLQNKNMPTAQQQKAQTANTKSPAKKQKPRNTDKKQKEIDDENKYFEPFITPEAVAEGIKNNTIVQGVIRINPNQFQFSYVSSVDRSEQDIHIDGVRNRNRALEGDVVAVELLPEPVSGEKASESKENNVSGSKQNNDSGSKQNNDSGSKQNNDSGSKPNNDSGGKQSNGSGSKESNDSQSQENNASESKQNNVSESKQSNDSENKQSNDSGSKQSNDSGSKQNNDSGTKQNDDSGTKQNDDSGSKKNYDSGSKQSNGSESKQNNGSESKQKKGKVVRIVERVHTKTCIGNLKLMPDKNRQRALFTPRDHRVPRLNIPFTNWPNNFYESAKEYENTLFLAKIVDWFDVRFAIGNISCILGQAGDMMTETIAILAQNDLDVTPYGRDVRHLFPRLDFVIPECEIKNREDCRKLCIFSIDPFSCRDIDDAVSCKPLPNGNYEIGVHISDVSYFMKEDTILDAKVANKATTIYMVERAYHMLPDELCMLCSLFPGVDKLAFSVFWEITEDGQVLSHRFAKTVIHSCAQLAYEHAQAVLEDKENAESQFPEIHNGFKYRDLYITIKTLGKISRIFRDKRFSGGALRIDQPKVAFNLSPSNGMPESYWIHESKESHQLIEEFMLLANITVARKIYEDYPKMAFLRAHPPPNQFMMKQLQKQLRPIGVEIDITSAGSIQRSLLPYIGPNCPDKGKAMVLNMLCAKPMARAKYFCAAGCDDEDFLHYALNVPMYTHFTSPIRRYADIMVHRLLAASLKYREVPKWEVSKIRNIAAQCNKQKYNAKKAGEMSTELYILKYISMHAPLVTEAVVVEIKDKYIDVIIVKMGLNRRLFFNNDFPGSIKCLKNDANSKQSRMKVTWSAHNGLPAVVQLVDVFETVQVEMYKAEEINKVDARLARPVLPV